MIEGVSHAVSPLIQGCHRLGSGQKNKNSSRSGNCSLKINILIKSQGKWTILLHGFICIKS